MGFNIKNGKVAFAYNSNQGKSWRNLGTDVTGAMTSSEAIKLAGLDYTVRKDKIAVIFPEELGYDVKGKVVPDKFAVYRTDTRDIFGVVSDRYEIIQNVEAFNFIDSIIGEERAIIESAGALNKGEKVFVSAKLPYYIKINGSDTVENYLMISNSHDGSSSIEIYLTPIRIWCYNVLAISKSSAKFMIKLRHTSSVKERMEDARNILEISKTITEETQELYQTLAKTKIKDVDAKEYFQNVLLSKEELNNLAKYKIDYRQSGEISTRKKNVINSVIDFYHSGVGQEPIVGTGFGAYNAINGYLSNVKPYKTDEKRMESLILGGSDYKLNEKALELAIDSFVS